MGFFDSIGKIVIVLLIVGGIFYILNNFDFSRKISLDPEAIRATPYIKEIVYDDIELRQFTASVTKGCAGDKECQVNKVFRYVVDNYEYYSDPAGKEGIQSPYETMSIEGGDCEDFSILMNSMFESIGLKTYLVLTDTHAYGLVCGVNPDKLTKYVEESLLQKYATDSNFNKNGNLVYENNKIYLKEEHNKQFVLDPYSTYYFGGDGSNIATPFINARYDYSLTFFSPVDFYVVSGQEEYQKLANGDSFKTYSSCTELSTLKAVGECTIKNYGGIAISNKGGDSVQVTMDMNIYYLYSSDELLKDVNIVSYQIDGESCVVLDGTSGKYGYPGYKPSDLVGKKVAIDPITK
ncbi:MAG: transglutaminase-like domain-containing protein, partial [Nanoarchaeota archaeon]